MTTEGAFTRPREECPNPNWWHATDGQATEHEVTRLVAGMVGALQPELVVETGAHIGNTTAAIGRALVANGHGRLVAYEVDRELVSRARARVVGMPAYVAWGSSLEADIPADPIDMLWLDSAMRTPEGGLMRIEELYRFGPALSDRAVVMVHDTGSHRQDLRDALDTLTDFGWVHLPTPRGVSIGRRE